MLLAPQMLADSIPQPGRSRKTCCQPSFSLALIRPYFLKISVRVMFINRRALPGSL